ncbi:MAG: efflux RND transporter periplasmic adaptor subunit, partial [Deltaproteobacteria bacterium]|nr:efflux RND transporter periplasmic adaptor subunit [Deltaproteobacteria bacterium]
RQQSSGVGKKPARSSEARSAIPVTVTSVVQKHIPLQVAAIGAVEAYSTVAVRAQVTGTLTRVHFKEGQDVQKGDLLFTIDPRPFEATLKQAEATLAKDTALLENAREQARRYAELVKKEYVSREQHDQVRANADALEATVEADRAAVETTKVQLSYCYIYSTLDGRVGGLLVNEGNLVRVNDATPLVIINQINPIYVTFFLPEQNLAEIKSRMVGTALKVQATIPESEDRPEEGTLSFIDNAVDRTTGTIKFKGTFANGNRRLWPGQFVRVALTLSNQPDAIVIPSRAGQTGQDGQHVFVLKTDSAVELRSVVISRTVGGEAVIEKGLQRGEKVVTDGQFLLGPGSRVQVKKEAKS